ncbi:MAG: hypothetical protein INQ03_01265 [Candidatus Heimdallarchaeota archaeon]|nr:hypothetical protein [Candidatus Heimdallarchaeota archaeon]
MSYLNQRGKQVWGSSVYRIEILTESKRLNAEFAGKMTLFERRHEASTKLFENIEMFIEYLKEMWAVVLPNRNIQDARVARWVEEYLNELNIQCSYQEALDAMRGLIEEVETLEITEEKKLEEDQIQKLVEVTDDYIITGITKSIKGDLTDLSSIEKVLTKFLADNKPTRDTSAKSTISFKDSNAQTRGMEENRKIVLPILDENISLWTGYSNTFSDPVKELSIVDVIPYCFKLVKVDCEYEHKKSERLTEAGREITWEFGDIPPGNKIQVNYELEHRMIRTILIRDDNDITLLHMFEDIKREGQDIWVETQYTFREKTDVLEHVKILDQFPNNFQFSSSTPEATEPLGVVREFSTGAEVEWTHKNVPVNTQFVVTYDLKENQKIYRDKIILQDDNDQVIAEVMKLVKPLNRQKGYGIIFAIQTFGTIPEILITDRVSQTFKIEGVHVDYGNIEEEQGDIMKKIRWKLIDLEKSQIYMAFFKYLGSDNLDFSNFNIIIPNRASAILEQETNHKAEKIVLPYIYQTKVDG